MAELLLYLLYIVYTLVAWLNLPVGRGVLALVGIRVESADECYAADRRDRPKTRERWWGYRRG